MVYVPKREYEGVFAIFHKYGGVSLLCQNVSEEDEWLLSNQWLSNNPRVTLERTAFPSCIIKINHEGFNHEIDHEFVLGNMKVVITANGHVLVNTLDSEDKKKLASIMPGKDPTADSVGFRISPQE